MILSGKGWANPVFSDANSKFLWKIGKYANYTLQSEEDGDHFLKCNWLSVFRLFIFFHNYVQKKLNTKHVNLLSIQQTKSKKKSNKK